MVPTKYGSFSFLDSLSNSDLVMEERLQKIGQRIVSYLDNYRNSQFHNHIKKILQTIIQSVIAYCNDYRNFQYKLGYRSDKWLKEKIKNS